MDVSVLCGAECNTDHEMLRLKLVGMKMFRRSRDELSTQRFEVSKLQGRSVDDICEMTTRGEFQKQVSERVLGGGGLSQ